MDFGLRTSRVATNVALYGGAIAGTILAVLIVVTM